MIERFTLNVAVADGEYHESTIRSVSGNARTFAGGALPMAVAGLIFKPIAVPDGKLGMDAAALEATAAQIQSQVPLGRFGEAREVAATVLHLAAPESAFIVGTEIVIDGGMSQL